MIGLKDIKSITTFKRNTREYIKKMKKSGNPLILTVKGKAELIVQDAASYQRMIETIDRLEAIGDLREGMESVRQGKTMSLDKFDKRMRKNIHAARKC